MPDWLMQAVGMVFVAGAVYGGIRVEQRAMWRDIIRQEKAIERVHQRLDECGVCFGRRSTDG